MQKQISRKKINIRSLLLTATVFSFLSFQGNEALAQGAATEVVTLGSQPKPTASLNCEEARFVKLINMYRNSLKLSTLKVAYYGVSAARWHAADMGNKHYFSHTEPTGRDAFDRMNYFNYPGQAENIAAGYKDASKVFCGWKKSPGHNKNMKGAKWTTVSIGLVATEGSRFKTYWSSGFSSKQTQLLTEPLAVCASCPMPKSIPSCI